MFNTTKSNTKTPFLFSARGATEHKRAWEMIWGGGLVMVSGPHTYPVVRVLAVPAAGPGEENAAF